MLVISFPLCLSFHVVNLHEAELEFSALFLAYCIQNHAVEEAEQGGDYHKATGLEALFGYLYFQGNNERIRELFDATTQDL